MKKIITTGSLLLAAIFLSGCNQQPVSNIQPPSSTPTPSINLFTNQDGKYSFEFPPTWKVAVNKHRNNETLFGPNADSSSGLGGIEVFENQVSVDKFLKNIGANFINKTKVSIDGIPATRVHYKGLPVSGEQVVLFDNGKIYNIFVNSEKTEDIKSFEQIIASFKLSKL